MQKTCIRNYAAMSRRRFMALMAAASASTLLPHGRAEAKLNLPGPGENTNVILTGVPKSPSDEGLFNAVRSAAESATDFSWLSKGDAVLIKPVQNSGNPYPATTSPVALKAMIKLLKEKGAGRVIVSDMSGIEHVKLTVEKLDGSSRELMQKSGTTMAVESAGGELYLPEEHGWNDFFEDGPAPGSNWKAGIMMPKILKEVDHVILMPRCGRHMLAGSTLGMKAAVGYWRTDSRFEYHHDAATLQEKTAEANTVSSLRQKQRLVLTAATSVLSTFGPDKGYISVPDTGLVIASTSIVAHDMLSLAWLLETRKHIPESEISWRKDPYTVQTAVNAANRVVVMWLNGMTAAVTADSLIRNDIQNIWEDRVLNRAFHLWNGVPRLNLIDPTDSVPAEIKQTLRQMTTVST